jgi:DNA-binding CsgD family transcriptional regulator
MLLSRHPELTAALLDVCAAVTYEDFADAAVRFCRTAVPHTGGEVFLNYLDFDANTDHALLVRSQFPTKRARTPEERASRQEHSRLVGDFLERHPETRVYRGQNHTLPPMAELEKTVWFKEFMVPEGWHDFLGMSFRSGVVVHSSLFVNRAFNQPSFSAAEAALFEEAYPYFAAALQRVRLLENTRAVRTDLESSLLDLPVATLLLNWQLGVEHANRLAARMCMAWQHGFAHARTRKPGRLEVPPDLLAACRQLRQSWSSPGHGGIRLLRRTLSHPQHPELHATITLLRPHSLRLAAPTFLIRITEVTASVGGAGGESADVTALLTRLSSAEREILPHLRRGLSNKEIAVALGKAVPTVKKQLHAVMAKAGVTSRTRLITLLQ